VGLGNADNTSDANKPISTATQSALNLKANLASPTFTGTVGGITKSMVGLGSVDNTADSAKPVSTAQQAALDLKAPLASPAFTGNPTGITKSHVGLANVDNTSDASKPASTAQLQAMAQGVHAVGAGIDATGASDSTTAIQAKIDAAATSPYGKAVYLPAGTFLCAGLTLPSGVSLFGFGTVLQAPSAATVPILTIAGSVDCTVRGITFKGNLSQYSADGLSSPSGTQEGIRIDDSAELLVIEDCWFRNFGFAGLRAQTVGNPTTGSRFDGCTNSITNCQAENCYYGFQVDTRAEYITFTNCTAIKNRFGMQIKGGNTKLLGCSINTNYLGLHIANDTNSGHGSAVGCLINHNSNIAIQVDEQANGFMFSGCQIFYGIVYLYLAGGVMFGNCTFGAVTIRAQGGGKNLLNDNFITGGTTMTHNYNSVTSSVTMHNNYRVDGTALT
jgi:hypothetical protein